MFNIRDSLYLWKHRINTISYGLTPFGLSKQIGVSVEEAKVFIKEWRDNLSKAHEWIEWARSIPHNKGYTTTPFGRKRRFGLVTEAIGWMLENESCNSIIQSTASDLTLLSVIQIQDKLRDIHLDAKMVNTVHDSIIFEVKDDPQTINKLASISKEIMERIPHEELNTNVPFKVDIEIGDSWGSLKEISI